MIEDLRTVVWKEWKSVLRWRGSRMRAILTLLMPLVLFGLWLPWEAGEAWLQRLPPSALIEREGEVVTRGELLEEVWE